MKILKYLKNLFFSTEPQVIGIVCAPYLIEGLRNNSSLNGSNVFYWGVPVYVDPEMRGNVYDVYTDPKLFQTRIKYLNREKY